MANKNLKSIKFPGLGDTYIVPQVDNTLTQAGRPADAKKTGDEISALKEDLSTLNTEGTVPTSEQMLSDNYTEDSVPYHFRKTASDNADREELEIVGGSVAWNQLIDDTFNFNSPYTHNGITFTRNSDGSITVNGTISGWSNAYCAIANNTGVVVGHKYYMTTNSNNIYVNMWYNGVGYMGCSKIIELTTKANGFFLRINTEGTTVSNEIVKPQVFDLTAMFGSTIADHIYSLEQATAGAGVALFRSLFPKDYYAFDAGSMQSVSGLQSHNTVGFNAWDEEIELGKIDYRGNNLADTTGNNWRTKNYIPVIGGTPYYSKIADGYTAANSNHALCFYDKDKAFIEKQSNKGNLAVTTPSNCAYVRIEFYYATAITSPPTGLCYNLSDPAKNGQYEPYDGHSYALDDSLTLRGIPTLVDGKIKWDGDVYASDGKVTRRYGIVDLGTLNWSKDSDYGNYYYASGVQKAAGLTNMICVSYVCTEEYGAAAPNKTVRGALSGDTTRLFIRDEAYTDAATFKAAMSGVYLVYELATPTTESADPYVSPQICDPNGTEEFVSTGIVPVGHTTKYPDNLRMKLDNLPWNFASLIAPTESGFKATRNYTAGALLIVNNVLYKATANIANGATITVGTNVTATTLAEVIAAL